MFVVDSSTAVHEAVTNFGRKRRHIPLCRIVSWYNIKMAQQKVRLQAGISTGYNVQQAEIVDLLPPNNWR